MFKLKKRRIMKLAGTSMPEDQKLWPAEVLKSLVSQHPYIDTSRVKIAFTRIEPETKSAVGKIMIDKMAAIPFSIRPDEKSRKLELDSLDIVYDGSQFKHLNEDSLQNAVDKQQVGRVERKGDAVPPGNRYVGDMTGDITPLEWSAYPSGFAGPRTVSAGQGLLSYVIRNQQDVGKLFNLLNTYDGINSTMEAMGIRDSLDALKSGIPEVIEKKRLAHIMKRPEGGGFAVAFDGGDTRAVSAKDLRNALGQNFEPVMRHVMQRGWGMVRDFPTLRTVDHESLKILPCPIEIGGRHRVIDTKGNKLNALVCDQMIDFDGQVIKNQKAIIEGTQEYALGKALQGWAIPEVIPQAFDEHKRMGALNITRDYPIGAHITNFPIGVIDLGVSGTFIDESWGTPKCTPNFTVDKIIEMPGEPQILLCTRTDTKGKIGLITVDGLVRPQKVMKGHYDENLMPPNSYYMPAHMSFVQTNGMIQLADKQALMEHKPEALLKKNASMYFMHGETEDGFVDWKNMTAPEVRTKLAWWGVNDETLEDVMGMGNGESRKMIGLKDFGTVIEKTASSLGLDYTQIKNAAEESIKAVDGSPESQDPQTMDAVLSLQFVSDENLEDLLSSRQVFEESEDKLARLLLAARQGERSIHEKGVQRALRGIGEARKSLKTLEIELQSRET